MTEKNINGLLAVFFILLAAGFAFHQSETFAGSLPGHLIGIVGAVLMFLTLVYPFRKRVLGKGARQNPIGTHIFCGLAGPSLVVIHAAHKSGSRIALLAFVAMLVVVLSGITGRFLFRRVSRTLSAQQRELAALKDAFQSRRQAVAGCEVYFGLRRDRQEEEQSGTENAALEEDRRHQCEQLVDLAQSISDLEYATTIFDSARTLFSKWMRVHHILALFLFSLVTLHIVTALYYGLRWIP